MIFDLLRRKSAEALTPQKLAAMIGSEGVEIEDGVRTSPLSLLQQAAVFACVRVISESIGQLPLHLMRKRGAERTKAEEHPLYRLLHIAPNDWQTSQEFWEMCGAHMAWRGFFAAQKIVSGSRVVALEPIHPDAVTIEQKPDKSVWFRVSEGGTYRALPATDVFYVPLFTLDGVHPVSPVGFAKASVWLAKATEKHGRKLFANGVQPSGILSTDQILSDVAENNLKSSLAEQYAGLDNTGNVMLLHSGLKWSAMGMSSEDAQYLETRKFQRSEIAGIFRVPPHKIGDLERATFSNIEQQDLDFYKSALVPYLTRIEQRIRFSLLSEKDQTTHYAKFNVGGLLRGDWKSRAEAIQIYVQNGMLSPNEARELEDWNPRPGGDSYLTPANMLIDGKAPPKAEAPQGGADANQAP